MCDRHPIYDLTHIDDTIYNAHAIYDDLEHVYDDMRNKGYIYEDCAEAVYEAADKWRKFLKVE